MKTINYKGKGEHSVNELELIISQQAEELHLLKSGQKQLPIHGVIERLPIGTEVTIIDQEDWGEQRGTKKTITGYTDFGKKQGYLLDGVGIYLAEDFEANVL